MTLVAWLVGSLGEYLASMRVTSSVYSSESEKPYFETNSLSNEEPVKRVSDIRCIIRKGSIN